jgi:hypothetical protein
LFSLLDSALVCVRFSCHSERSRGISHFSADEQITQAFVWRRPRYPPATADRGFTKAPHPDFSKATYHFALDHLINAGAERFIVNTHRRPELFENFFRDNEYEGHSVTLVHEPDLLETGGGIKNAERYLGSDPFLTYSGDILTDINLQPLIDEHFRAETTSLSHCVKQVWLRTWPLRDHRVVDIANRIGTRGILISRTSLFGIRRFSSKSRRNKKFRSFQLLRIG